MFKVYGHANSINQVMDDNAQIYIGAGNNSCADIAFQVRQDFWKLYVRVKHFTFCQIPKVSKQIVTRFQAPLPIGFRLMRQHKLLAISAL